MSEALYAGLATALGGAGQEMQYQNRQDAAARRAQSLAELKRKWQIEDREDRQAHAFDVEAKRHEYTRADQLFGHALTAPEREADLEATSARTASEEARTGYYGAQTEQTKKQTELMGQFGGADPTANQRDVAAIQQAFDVDPSTAWMIHKGWIDSGGRADAVGLAEGLFENPYGGGASVGEFVENHPGMASALEITPDTPFDQALDKVSGRMEKVVTKLPEIEALKPRDRLAPGQGGLTGPNPQQGAQGQQDVPNFPGVPRDHSLVAQAALEALQQGRDPQQVRARMIQKGTPEEVADRIIGLARRGR